MLGAADIIFRSEEARIYCLGHYAGRPYVWLSMLRRMLCALVDTAKKTVVATAKEQSAGWLADP